MKTGKYVVEFIGTFALIFIGAGALAITGISLDGHSYSLENLLAVALAHGFVVIAFVYAYGHISGTHINPAVTLGLLVAGEIRFVVAIGYWIVQFAGGIAGALVLKAVLPIDGDLGVTILAENVSVTQGLFVEIILTFFLVTTIFNTAVSGKAGNFAGIAIGLSLIACILMGGPLTRASFNPARTLGPAIAAGNYADLWLYFVGPCVGAVLAALLYLGMAEDKDTR